MVQDIDNSFLVKTCSLASIATGETASSLMELRDKIATVDEGCIYYHFWGGRLHPQFTHPQYHNDFASWIHARLHDQVLAEKLSIIDPTEFENLNDLRSEIHELLELSLDSYESISWTKREDRFHFIRSTIVVFESPFAIKKPEDLPQALLHFPSSSIFYHFIDARSRTPEKTDDFSTWLKMFGDTYGGLIEKIQAIDPYFLSLTESKDELIKVTSKYFSEG